MEHTDLQIILGCDNEEIRTYWSQYVHAAQNNLKAYADIGLH